MNIRNIKINKGNILVFVFILFLAVFPLYHYFNSWDHFINYGSTIDFGNFIAVNHYLTKESIFEYHQFPLWNFRNQAGTPLFAGPEVEVISLTTLFTLFGPSIFAGMKLSILIHYILAGLAIFLLARHLKLESRYAFISMLVYMWCGNALAYTRSYTYWTVAFAYIPYIVLFTLKAFDRKEWVKYSILAGFLYGLMFLSGAVGAITYFTFFYACMFLYFFLIDIAHKKYRRIIYVGIIVAIFAFGFSAIKILPFFEFTEISNRNSSTEFSYEFVLGQGHHISSFKDVFEYFIKKPGTVFPSYSDYYTPIGYFASFLVLLSFFRFRNKKILFFLIMLILAVLMASEGPVSYFLYKYVPMFDQQKNVAKSTILYSFSAAILAGVGCSVLSDLLTKKFKRLMKHKNYLVVLVIVIIMADVGSLGLFGRILKGNEVPGYYNVMQDITKNDIMLNISEDCCNFRFKLHEINGPFDGASYYSVFTGLFDVYGNGNIWHREYPVLGGIAENYDVRSKFYGILNVRYLISHDSLNLLGFRLQGMFNEPDEPLHDQKRKAHGPYLYYNEDQLPKSYITKDAVLVVGEEGARDRMIYSIMLLDEFDPMNAVLINGGNRISDFSAEELSKFKAIILTQGSVDENAINNLKLYKENGGVLVPDILNNENEFDQTVLIELFILEGDFSETDVNYYSPNKVLIDSGNKDGFLVLGEKYSMFPGWYAEYGGERLEILRTNGVVSSVYLDGSEEEVTFYYRPRSFIIGMWITLITLLVCLGYFGYYLGNKRKNN